MICCVAGLVALGCVLAARLVKTRVLRLEAPEDPAEWRLYPESR